ncbi:cytochrome c oxidase subunit II [Sphingosinicella sp. YJ22]|uniref:cytochrome c oxidase subunit II n=1 Tax=Sphingosinicella sp. YJ22 TaxID=1104780 RepID=UPI001FAFC285|nr:cytochrome c oxidase subunit II [Sphingosinicella sp. YJ22]
MSRRPARSTASSSPIPAAAPGTPDSAQAPEGEATQPQAGANLQAAASPTPEAATPAGQPAYSEHLEPTAGVGQPDGRMGIQDQVTPIGREAAGFHDYILMPAITIITLIVLALMIYVILRYRRAANPVPSRTTHHTLVEVIWTLVPVLILIVIAVPSIRLLANQYSPPNADLTVKVIGNQWYWTYEYPDHGIELTSNMLPEQRDAQAGARFRTAADGPEQLAVDERMVVPVGATVKLIVTSADVIHAFGVPAFWTKMDAVPGRLNETWFRAEREGVYFGMCYELCGARHGYMPIAVEVVSPAAFQRWVASRGGTMPGSQPNANPDSTQANTLGNALAAERPDGSEPVEPTNEIQATTNQPTVRERSPAGM